MRPYFECKIVKVKKREKEIGCRHETITWNRNDKTVRCKLCGDILMHNVEYKNFFPFVGTKNISESKGNWVNNENLDKIKFPVPCSYSDNGKHYGTLSKGIDNYGLNEYGLFNIDRQSSMNRVHSMCFLTELIERYNIHILKGKIIIFDEEE